MDDLGDRDHLCPCCGRCLACGLPAEVHEHDRPEPEPEPYGPGGPDQWLKGAAKELALLIREVEGPRPRQGGRK